MPDKINFPFVEKEGKFFAPVVVTEPTYRIDNGAFVADGTRIVSGIKGVYSQVRMTLSGDRAGRKAELFAVNTEAVHSSN